MEVAQKYTNGFHAMMTAFNNLPPNIEPRATGHIIEQIEMVQTIVANGFAYEVNGSVYFDVEAFNAKQNNDYGKLSGRRIDELLADAGLTAQDRAPMTPVVKLVFGADYDKTRLTEYAAVLSYAHRTGIARGSLADHLRQAEGGLKGVVQAERRLRRAETGKPVEPVDGPREALARKLRAMEPVGFGDIAPDGQEFALVMIRRLATGEIVVLGEVPEDVALVERAARRLIG